MARESTEAALERWKQLEVLQEYYKNFTPFLHDVMELLGFSVTELQEDIANYLEFGPHYSMIQAQRGQAKTTITAAYAVWDLIHNPMGKCLIVSAGGTQANEISTLVVRIILNMDELECMRPDKTAGDRTSVEAFDVHHSLKGVDKSPSVACYGITANSQGKRATLLIADDVESAKNSMTAGMREQLLALTRDFISQCQTGRIVYLGTPQSSESIYNTLPARGFTVRIWPGRYPTQDQLANYGTMLAPYLSRKLEADPSLGTGGGYLGDQGQPTDPELMDEGVLQSKERDQGPSFFQLQHMLNTRLLDALRFPLKTSDLVVLRVPSHEVSLPLSITRGVGSSHQREFTSTGHSFHMATPHAVSEQVDKLQGIVMYVDPAGGGANADETGYAVVGILNSNVYALAIGGVPGGYSPESMKALAEVAKKWQPNVVKIEKNMGYGAFREVWLPILREEHDCKVEDDYVTGQKELRIIGTLEPVIARGSLIINEDIVAADESACRGYSAGKRQTYSVFFQLAHLSRERGSLVHDDRLDALEGAVRHFQPHLALDQENEVKKAEEAKLAAFFKDPLGHGRYTNGPTTGRSILSRRMKR